MPDSLEWRAVVGWEGLYEVSEDGRVRRIDCDPVRELRAPLNYAGYPHIALCDGPRQEYGVRIHSLVAAAFIGPRPDELTVNHRDHNKTNNHWTNLEYITRSENTRLGAIFHGRTKISDEEVRTIRRRFADGETRYSIAKDLCLSYRYVLRICTGERRHLVA